VSWRPKQLVDIGANVITTVESADAHTPIQKEQTPGRFGPLITLPERRPTRAVQAFTLPQKERFSYATGFPSRTLRTQGLFYAKQFTLPLNLLETRFYFPGTDLPFEFTIDPRGTHNKWIVSTLDDINSNKWIASSSSKYRITVI